MDIYLIRHTKTDTIKGLCYGQSDVRLAETFVEEFFELQTKLPKFKDNCQFFSSPLSRCMKLAEKLSDKVTNDDRLAELDFGDWENRLFDDIDSDELKQWTNSFVDVSPPNGESFNDLCQRVGSFWQEVVEARHSETEQVFIVTHAGVIRALLAYLLKLPLANAFQFRVDLGSVHKLQYIHNYTYINYLNL
ncbi:MAG: alpha-ribazole phosphatase [Methylococcales bacterium]